MIEFERERDRKREREREKRERKNIFFLQNLSLPGKTNFIKTLQVETLFHEAGHSLQHTLTKQDDGLVSGIRNVEWDAVELPSQW